MSSKSKRNINKRRKNGRSNKLPEGFMVVREKDVEELQQSVKTSQWVITALVEMMGGEVVIDPSIVSRTDVELSSEEQDGKVVFKVTPVKKRGTMEDEAAPTE